MGLSVRCLVGRLREQARSHTGSAVFKHYLFTTIKCGSGLAREGIPSVPDLSP
ncbi:UNVERIFIED_ORG: hypothetical protein J2Y77_001113 [Pseudomonas lini]